MTPERDPLEIPTVLRRGHPDCPFKTEERPMAKIGEKEAQLKAMREQRVAQLESERRADAKAKKPAPRPVEPTPGNPPDGPPSPAEPGNMKEITTMKKAKAKTKAKPKAKANKKAASKRKAAPAGESKLATIVKLLQRPEGVTTKEVLEATGWPSVSMPQQAKSAGIELVKEKGDDGKTRYWDKAHRP